MNKLNQLDISLRNKNYNSLWFTLENENLKKTNKNNTTFLSRKKSNLKSKLVNIKTEIDSSSTNPVSIYVDFYEQNGGEIVKNEKKCKRLKYSQEEISNSGYKLNFSKIDNFCRLINKNLLEKNSYNISKIIKSDIIPISNFNLNGGFIYHVFEGGSDEKENSEITSINNGVYPGSSKLKDAGTGVFSNVNFNLGDLVERVPVLPIPIKDVSENILKDYVFMYDGENYGMALGYGAVYNHQNDPNISYNYTKDKKFMEYRAIKEVNKGDELFVSYGLGWWIHRNITPVDIEQ